MLFKLPQAISKFESLVNQIQKNAKDINSRLEMIENTILFKQPPPKIGGMLPDAKVCQVVHTVLTLLLSSCIMHLNAILKELTTKSILNT